MSLGGIRRLTLNCHIRVCSKCVPKQGRRIPDQVLGENEPRCPPITIEPNSTHAESPQAQLDSSHRICHPAPFNHQSGQFSHLAVHSIHSKYSRPLLNLHQHQTRPPDCRPSPSTAAPPSAPSNPSSASPPPSSPPHSTPASPCVCGCG